MAVGKLQSLSRRLGVRRRRHRVMASVVAPMATCILTIHVRADDGAAYSADHGADRTANHGAADCARHCALDLIIWPG